MKLYITETIRGSLLPFSVFLLYAPWGLSTLGISLLCVHRQVSQRRLALPERKDRTMMLIMSVFACPSFKISAPTEDTETKRNN
ncbi:hypothetical protein K7432_011753 [Basidiobolus ranarum]|uniref:Uncharacterized protein n=1 Tax=Basidiobolus ranarum TaxID=34480 RepID=A0ABR2WLV0_9FUNG